MRNLCQTITKVAIVNLYSENQLIASASAYFNIVVYPKISLSQRICKNNECTAQKVKIILKVLNFETRCFRNIRLINTISPNPVKLTIVKCDGNYRHDNNGLIIDFNSIPPLTVKTVEFEAYFDGAGEFTSIACLKEVILGSTNDEIIKSSICKRVI